MSQQDASKLGIGFPVKLKPNRSHKATPLNMDLVCSAICLDEMPAGEVDYVTEKRFVCVKK
jgi:hypothetical protein